MPHNATVYFLIILYVAQTTDKALAQTSDIEEFFLLIDERLSHMQHVALHKVENKIAIEDLEREQFVIESAVKSAAELGLFGLSIESFLKRKSASQKLSSTAITLIGKVRHHNQLLPIWRSYD